MHVFDAAICGENGVSEVLFKLDALCRHWGFELLNQFEHLVLLVHLWGARHACKPSLIDKYSVGRHLPVLQHCDERGFVVPAAHVGIHVVALPSRHGRPHIVVRQAVSVPAPVARAFEAKLIDPFLFLLFADRRELASALEKTAGVGGGESCAETGASWDAGFGEEVRFLMLWRAGGCACRFNIDMRRRH